MSDKDEQIEKCQKLCKALYILKEKSDILSYKCNRSYSKNYGENLDLIIEFEIPNELSIDFDIPSFINKTSKNSNLSIYNGNTSTDKSKSTMTDSSYYSSTMCTSLKSPLVSFTIYNGPKCKENYKYQALDTYIIPSEDENVEIDIYLKSFRYDKIKKGILEKITIEINPYKITLKDIIRILLPNKKITNVIHDGVSFIRKDFDYLKGFKEERWILCCVYQLDMPIAKIYGLTIKKDFKMSFIINDVLRF
ncbi:Hypothetical protein SRAE_1000112000 [Strongyloides ratti]|uniref:Uncharacterized protein n=1 Tax=Strongyloides ratti TaxID=34506 RepID=A0A090MVE2_STRRB|nr:Hypothetical protein SRAE_1000112000 [Strongyloides ratti]CEF62853.1 Hypothetical protein SRAE_1000112000 [Strongyloides ratti]